MPKLSIRRFASREAFDLAFKMRLSTALTARGASAVMLSGGTTPLPAYGALADGGLTVDPALRILFSDERYVPCDSEASNYHGARPLLDALALAPGEVLRVRTELPLEAAAADYETQLAVLLGAGVPIALGILGLGADGHTASLFSPDDLQRAQGRLAIPVRRPDGLFAVSVTPDLISRIAEPLFAVAGAGKQDALQALLKQDPSLTAWQAVQGCPAVQVWVITE
jgi:6-phosphogluconolactonase